MIIHCQPPHTVPVLPVAVLQLLTPSAGHAEAVEAGGSKAKSCQVLTVMMSEMPLTPCRSTSSATRKASVTGRLASTAAQAPKSASRLAASQLGCPYVALLVRKLQHQHAGVLLADMLPVQA